MALSQKYLEQPARRRSQGKAISTHPRLDGAERSNGTQELTRQARAAGHTGPLVLGPSRSSSKGSWRDDARILEELYPEDFGPPRNQPSSAPCVERSLVDSASREEPQPLATTPGSSQSAREALPVPRPSLATVSEAEPFAAAVETMPANVQRFFQSEEPVVWPRQAESAQDRLEREARGSFGGWCG